MAVRVVLFVDYQNVYMGERAAFFSWGSQHVNGQIDPWSLGQLLAARGMGERVLTQVRRTAPILGVRL